MGESHLKKQIAERINGVQLFLGRVMFEKAKVLERKGEKLIHFEIGEPDFDTPQHIKEAAKRALDEGYTHYVSNYGLLELRTAIAEKLKKDNNIEADPATEICVTVGSQEAAYLAIMCTIEPGDEVLISDPSYYTYRNCVRLAGGTPISVPLKEKEHFRLNPEELEEKLTPKSKMIVINSPCNPTGSIITEDDLKAIDEIAIKSDLLVLTDEIYEKIIYDGQKHSSIAALSDDPERIITANGFSKAYAMTGWRIGYMVAGKRIISEAAKIQQSAIGSATTFVQKGAVEALRGPQNAVRKMVDEFARRRDIIVDRLEDVRGLSLIKPKGAFYVFAGIKELGKSSQELAELLLNEAKVVTTPGIAFGENGEGFIRISCATSMENVREGSENIAQVLESL